MASARPGEKTSPATAPKLELFTAILGELINIWQTPGKILAASWAHPRAQVLDLHASTGKSVDGRDGSALIALRNMLANDVAFDLWLFEKSAAKCSELAQNIREVLDEHRRAVLDGPLRTYRRGHAGRRGPCPSPCVVCHPALADEWLADHVHIVQGDHNETIDAVLAEIDSRLRKPAYGLVVADPYGVRDLGQEPLIKISKMPKLYRLDFLVNVSATAAKRGNFAPVYELLEPVRKDRRLIRDTLPGALDRGWNWTMFLLTNWLGGPSFVRLGFHNVTSTEGMRLVEKFGLTLRERRGAAVRTAPLGKDCPTAPMRSISVTRGSSPSAPSSLSVAAASVNGASGHEQRSRIT